MPRKSTSRATVSAISPEAAKALTVAEFALRTRRGLNQVYRGIRTGEIKADKIGGAMRISVAEVARHEAAEPSPAARHAQADDDMRFYCLVNRLYELGVRPVAELLLELARERMLRGPIEKKLRRYTERLDPATLKALGADRLPSAPIHAVEAER
jgi:hypothetical protein